jgi:hypothetical protein
MELKVNRSQSRQSLRNQEKWRDNAKIFVDFARHFWGDFSAPRRKLGLPRDGFRKNDEMLCEI